MPLSSRPPSNSLRRLAQGAALAFALVLASIPIAGCSGRSLAAGSLRVESIGNDPVVLLARYRAAVYSDADPVETSFCLTDLPEEALMSAVPADGQIVHVDLLWQPLAGQTPMDDSAVNASIRYIIVVNQEVGIYGGAGFAVPQGKIGRRTLTVSIQQGSLKLLESTPGFVDVLGIAELRGKFTATLDNQATQRIQYAASQLVTNALGRSMYVDQTTMRKDMALLRYALLAPKTTEMNPLNP